KPARRTVFWLNRSGVHAKPIRGLTKLETLSQIWGSLDEAKVKPPGTELKLIGKGSFDFVLELNAATAASETGLVAPKLKPLTVRPSFSEYGRSRSKRMPMFSVKLFFTRQSSLMNSA